MAGSAAENRAALIAANEKLNGAESKAREGIEHNNNAGVDLNGAIADFSHAIAALRASIAEIDEALNLAREPTYGSGNRLADQGMAWLNAAKEALENEIQRLTALREKTKEVAREVSSVRTEIEEAVLRITGARGNFSGYATNL